MAQKSDIFPTYPSRQTDTAPDVDEQLLSHFDQNAHFVQKLCKIVQNLLVSSPESSRKLTISNCSKTANSDNSSFWLAMSQFIGRRGWGS